MNSTDVGTDAQSHGGKAFGTKGYRNFVLYSLTFLFTLNFIDRILISVVAEPLIREFKITDLQFGLLSGIGFALMYTLMGIPIARLAERYNRVKIIAASVIMWSAMTALCGVAGSFISLLIFRVGVGIGEAGLTPAANSIIADYFPPRSRARAIAIYSLGITFGGILANLFGGPIAQAFSWREAFIALGVPGLFFGVIFLFVVKEPPRGYADPPTTVKSEKLGIGDTIRELSSKRAFWVNMIAAAIVAFVGYGVTNFQAAFFQRAHGMTVSEVAIQIAVPVGIAASLGAFSAGAITEKLSGRYPNIVAWLPGCALILAVPFYWIGLTTANIDFALAVFLIAAFLHYSYLGAQYTICQGVASPRSRATAIALMLFVVNIIGYGGGPPAVGFLSDILMTSSLNASQFAGSLTSAVCKGSPAELIASLGQAKADVCMAANADGLRYSLMAIVSIFFIGGALYLYTCKTLQQDLIAKMN